MFLWNVLEVIFWNFLTQSTKFFISYHRLIPSDKLVNCLKLWERINAKLVVTILFLKNFDKTSNCAVLMICYAVQYPQTSTFQCKNKTHFTLKLVQNLTSLLSTSKNNRKWLKYCYDYQRFKNVSCASFRVWGLTR